MSLTRRSGLAAELARPVIVRLPVSEPAAAVALLCDDSPSALAGLEATAAGSAVRVALAGPSNELRARRRGGGGTSRRRSGWGRRRGGSLPTQLARRGVVGLGVAKPAPAVALLRDNRARALPALEAATPGRTIGVALAWAGDELRAGGGGGHGGGGRGRAGVGGGFAAELAGSVVVRLPVSESTAAVALLRDDGPSALAGLEATAAGGAVDVAGAWAGDELGARRGARDVRRGGDCEKKAGGESSTFS